MVDSEVQADKLNHDSLIDAVLKHEPYHGDASATKSDLDKLIRKVEKDCYHKQPYINSDGVPIGMPMTLKMLEQCIENYRHNSASIGVPLTLELLEQCIEKSQKD